MEENKLLKTANKKEYFKQYYINNKNRYKTYAEQNKMKFYCPLCDVSVYHMSIHFKSQKHKAKFPKSDPIDIHSVNVEGILPDDEHFEENLDKLLIKNF